MQNLSQILNDWEAVIGLEVHAVLTTLNTKMFCGCKLEFGAEPNTHTCPVCLGMPGALPVPNKAAIESICLAGLATNCEIKKKSMFYRKNYMYPDMAKNFQTTQGSIAFCMNGHLELDISGNAAKERLELKQYSGLSDGESADNITITKGGYKASLGITRIHMEEDAGKMVHIGGSEGRIAGASHSLIDYNRAGMPLIELVTEPDIRTPEEARLFMQKLRSIYLTLGISDCSMEEGSLRCDGNISMRRRGDTKFGTKTELKNMNSFKNLHDGLAYEICRQVEVLEAGGQIYQETRHWDSSQKRTISMRVKETADDYRLFPEPDMVPFDLSDEFIQNVREKQPELPDQKADRFVADFKLNSYDANQLANDAQIAKFFDESMAKFDFRPDAAKAMANFLINTVFGYLNEDTVKIFSTNLSVDRAVELIKLQISGDITKNQAKQIFDIMISEDKDPAQIVEEKGLKQLSYNGVIDSVVDEVLAENHDKVQQYKNGKTGLLRFFIGQCMRKMNGQGNPLLINKTLSEKLNL
ncbi:MAG: Asp-tRNA(Asn)/Glu-tRNA(Gln) amidotransferase subunit GatB [Eggerthellaceae bacterium]|nr:Asp-tRNA(Asn)/Glu-tRNA(Gln) amidotransferase subunit GatB [Eggerthellaceae bacterium]